MNLPPAFVNEFKQFESYQAVFCASNLHELAKQTGFIFRNRKLSAAGFGLLCCFLPSAGCYPSLDQMLGALLVHWGIRMRKSSLHERFTASAVAFIREMFQQVLAREVTMNSLGSWTSRFKEIIVLDSTVVNLSPQCADLFAGFGGGASASSAKIQFNLGLLSGKIWEMGLLPGRSTDLSYRLGDIQQGALYLFDLGYACADNFKTIIQNNAWFLTRYKYKTTLYRPNGQPISQRTLLRLVKTMKVGSRIDMQVLLGATAQVPCRLVLEKLPQDVADQIRRKLSTDKQKKIKQLSAERLLFCDVNAYITNLSQSQLPADTMRAVYGIRWQIEILFKTWKSFFRIDQTRNIGPYQFQCCLYGALIRIVISSRIFQILKLQCWNTLQIELSEIKAMKYLDSLKPKFARWLFFGSNLLGQILEETWLTLSYSCRKEPKKGDNTPFALINVLS